MRFDPFSLTKRKAWTNSWNKPSAGEPPGLKSLVLACQEAGFIRREPDMNVHIIRSMRFLEIVVALQLFCHHGITTTSNPLEEIPSTIIRPVLRSKTSSKTFLA